MGVSQEEVKTALRVHRAHVWDPTTKLCTCGEYFEAIGRERNGHPEHVIRKVLETHEIFMDEVGLLGETEPAQSGHRVQTAGEFAAMWNAKSATERDDLMVQLLHQQDTTARCFQADHEGAVEQLKHSVNANVVLAALGSLGLILHDSGINPMVRVSNARHRVASLVQQLESQGSRGSRWMVLYVHEDCAECEDCAESALQHAKETGDLQTTFIKAGTGHGAKAARL